MIEASSILLAQLEIGNWMLSERGLGVVFDYVCR